MENIRGLLKKCFKPQPWPEVLEKYLEHVKSMEFETDPDYPKLRYANHFVRTARLNSLFRMIQAIPVRVKYFLW